MTEKLNPLRDVYFEFPRAMRELARVTVLGHHKYAPRDWLKSLSGQEALDYHSGRVGRHLLAHELEGAVNQEDENVLHWAQATWNMLAHLEHWLRECEHVPSAPAEAYERRFSLGDKKEQKMVETPPVGKSL